ncbi:MAG: cell division protein ZapA [Fibrobacteres bacterium]|jgi:cell division protein ZapA|nr:cell division protein ZapA [Fibrobacterota bacterium]
MEPVEHSYKVNICGETFQVKSDQPPQTIERVAGYLDFKIRELGKGGINVDKFRVVVLAAMNLAGELFELRAQVEEHNKQQDKIQEKARSLNASLDRALKPV